MFDLILGDGYPYPYPEGLTEQEQDDLAASLAVEDMRLKGVVSVEWRFELTIEFVDRESYDAAKATTGWEAWDEGALLLSATLEGREGRGDIPALIVGDKAYCRWMIVKGKD
ncbi:hypothetical protein [Xanthobacter wiegelii]|uniref:hypothetical protein n=1 Tax=Xanthobacter wiegelii TaxID=3119913 RepID=UPI0037264E5E